MSDKLHLGILLVFITEIDVTIKHIGPGVSLPYDTNAACMYSYCRAF